MSGQTTQTIQTAQPAQPVQPIQRDPALCKNCGFKEHLDGSEFCGEYCEGKWAQRDELRHDRAVDEDPNNEDRMSMPYWEFWEKYPELRPEPVAYTIVKWPDVLREAEEAFEAMGVAGKFLLNTSMEDYEEMGIDMYYPDEGPADAVPGEY